MRRKLIQHGLSSLTVSLPRKWVKSNNLSKGQEIELEEHSGNILITTRKKYIQKKITLDISGAGPMIRRIIGATYKTGYDEVEIFFSSFDELKLVQDLVREQFTGFEIICQRKNSITIKNLSQINFEEFNNVLRRFFLILRQISEEISQAIEKNDFSWLKNITLLKKESDKFADYCRKAINLNFETHFKRLGPLYTLIEQLEKVVDRYVLLAEYISDEELTLYPQGKILIKELDTFLDHFYTLFYKFEVKKIIAFGVQQQKIKKKIDLFLNHSSKKEIRAGILMDEILNLIFDLNGPLMAVYL